MSSRMAKNDCAATSRRSRSDLMPFKMDLAGEPASPFFSPRCVTAQPDGSPPNPHFGCSRCTVFCHRVHPPRATKMARTPETRCRGGGGGDAPRTPSCIVFLPCFFLSFPPSPLPPPHPLPLPRSLLTCACLCPCVLRPGIKRNTVWTQPMPSKFLAASWLHGMEYLELYFVAKHQDTPVSPNDLELASDWICVCL